MDVEIEVTREADKMKNQHGLSFVEITLLILAVGAFCAFVSHQVNSYKPSGVFIEAR